MSVDHAILILSQADFESHYTGVLVGLLLNMYWSSVVLIAISSITFQNKSLCYRTEGLEWTGVTGYTGTDVLCWAAQI